MIKNTESSPDSGTVGIVVSSGTIVVSSKTFAVSSNSVSGSAGIITSSIFADLTNSASSHKASQSRQCQYSILPNSVEVASLGAT